eukprot:COSAG04_NODE_349_length_16104_cov_34.698032_6_plen_58_part_00
MLGFHAHLRHASSAWPAGRKSINENFTVGNHQLFAPLAQLPQNKVGAPRPPDPDPLT